MIGVEVATTFTVFATTPVPPPGTVMPYHGPQYPQGSGPWMLFIKVGLTILAYVRSGKFPLKYEMLRENGLVGLPDILFELIEENLGIPLGDLDDIIGAERHKRTGWSGMIGDHAKGVVWVVPAWKTDP